MIADAEGYVTEISYTRGYYKGLNPLHMKLAFLLAGLEAPEVETACELGCGQGVSLAIHAAASRAHWFGNDINPTHVAFGRELLDAAGARAELSQDTFADFDARSDLPDFDFIGLHGVWSWVSDGNRSTIVDFIDRRLKKGGVLYISYNTLPGWMGMVPIRHLLMEHMRGSGTGGGIASRIDAALDFASKLFMASDYGKEHPKLLESILEMKKESHRYLAHEYFNRDWRPVHFADLWDMLAPLGLAYACSARCADDIDILKLTPPERALVGQIDDPRFRQAARDFVLDRGFRCDYWVRGQTDLSAGRRAELIAQTCVVAAAADLELPAKLRMVLALNREGPSEAALAAVVDVLSDRRVHGLADLAAALARQGVPASDLMPSIMLLAGEGKLAAAHDPPVTEAVAAQTVRLNARLLREAEAADPVECLASPVTGGGVEVGGLEQLFLVALAEGRNEPAQWAERARAMIVARRPKDAPAVDDVVSRAAAFASGGLPALRALRVVSPRTS